MVDVDPLSMDSSMSVEINDYENLKYLLMNEKASPEILPYQEDLVSRLYLKIEQQEHLLAETEASGEFELMHTILTIELTRVKYMLRAYLRTRIEKVEKYVMHCINSPEVRDRLSPLEDSHAMAYLRLVGSHLKTYVTNKFPEAFSSVTKQASAHPNPDMIPVPDTGQHVFMKAKRDLGQVQVYDDGAVHELYRGDVYILRYKVVKSLLEAGAVQLV